MYNDPNEFKQSLPADTWIAYDESEYGDERKMTFRIKFKA